MYYKSVSYLPQQIQESLPFSAQKTYLSVFNKAWEQYKDDQTLTTQKERESTAHQRAWEEVEKEKLSLLHQIV